MVMLTVPQSIFVKCDGSTSMDVAILNKLHTVKAGIRTVAGSDSKV